MLTSLPRSLVMLTVVAFSATAGHRESPSAALDHKVNITDVFAFRSYNSSGPAKVTLILCVDPLADPSNGPVWWPFDPDILYEIKIDNNNDARPDITFQFRFTTEQRLPSLYQVYFGVDAGVSAPSNSPPPVAPGTLIVPPRIDSFFSIGLGQRQSYEVHMVKNGISTDLTEQPLYVVPANAGPRTMDYTALYNAGIFPLANDIKVFAGTTDDPFWADLGGLFDTFNLRVGPFLNPGQDKAPHNFGKDTLAGRAVNAIAIEVPVTILTSTGRTEAANSPAATVGVWATTSRPSQRSLSTPNPEESCVPDTGACTWVQRHRMANPLIDDLVVGTAFKDRFSFDDPFNDSQFASFFLDPGVARVLNALTGGQLAIATPPRLDLLTLITYTQPIAPPGTVPGPIADLLRLNTGVNPTPTGRASRLGLLGGDPAGFPNGRRLFDDATDIFLRMVVGGVLAGPPFSTSPINNRLGDGVNKNDVPFRMTFPFLAECPSGNAR